MAEMLTDGLAHLRSQMKAHDSRTVMYRRGVALEIEITARVGRTPAEEIDEGGGIVRQRQYRDWIVSVDDLAEFGKPESGDVVTDGARTFEVRPVNSGEPPFILIGRDAAYRIHSLEKGS